MELEEAKSRLKIIHDYEKQVYDMCEMKTKIVPELSDENRKAIETVLQALENSIPKEVIIDKILERKFELQQDYIDFESDIKLNTLQDLLK